MVETRLETTLRAHRDRAGMSQAALAERVGVSRQAIVAIESGRQTPSTSLALLLARELGTSVERLFQLPAADGLIVRVAPPLDASPTSTGRARVAVAEVAGRWVAHRLPPDASLAADGLVVDGAEREATVRPLVDVRALAGHVLVAGCAPLLGAVARRAGAGATDVRVTWLPASSHQALSLLAEGLVHVAGLHLAEDHADHVDAARRALPGRRLLLVQLTRWRQGLVVAAGNPLGLRAGADLLRPGLRLARRGPGAGAHALVGRLVAAAGGREVPGGPSAAGHADVAQLVRCGAADVGVAIESVALAAGLDFVPLVSERFDLVVPAELAASGPVARLLDAVGDAGFRAEVDHLPGYDVSSSGHVTTLDAA